jgi:hypothetical protein
VACGWAICRGGAVDAVVGLQWQWYTFEVVSFVAEVLCASTMARKAFHLLQFEMGNYGFFWYLFEWHFDDSNAGIVRFQCAGRCLM